MYPAPACILSAVIFTPYVAKNLAPNTLRIAKQAWNINQELVFDAIWYERAEEIIGILLEQRARLVTYGLPAEKEQDIMSLDAYGPYRSAVDKLK
eukprot:9973068-Prorocentrum_lima.AAC.1